jgi:hypothetical protein
MLCCRSVGIVCLQTQATEFGLVFSLVCYAVCCVMFQELLRYVIFTITFKVNQSKHLNWNTKLDEVCNLFL